MSLVIKKGDLFKDAPKGAVLAHACNAQGIWGAGIAEHFRFIYINAYDSYAQFCRGLGTVRAVGKCHLFQDRDNFIASLITSSGFGRHSDSPEKILDNTRSAVKDLFRMLPDGAQIHSPKINSGLFKTPWEGTQKVIEECLRECDKKNITWTVWEL